MADQLGIQSIAIPEEYGGAGFGFGELSVVLEEAGRVLLCSPLFSTVVLAATTLLESGDTDAARGAPARDRRRSHGRHRSRSSRRTAAGARRASRCALFPTAPTSASPAPSPSCSTAPRPTWSSSPREPKRARPCSPWTPRTAASKSALPTLDQTRRQATLVFTDAPARLMGEDGQGWKVLSRVLDIAAAALACEQVGGAARVLESTVDYVNVREQFGRPVGSFQAVKHKLADMLVELESARSAAYYATSAVESDSADLPLAASIAKTYCSTAYYHIAAESIQLHGGIGFTWEHPAHLYFKRAKGSEILLGSPAFHRERIAQRLAL